MAVAGSRKRSADKGHHQYGELVTFVDGTKAFKPFNAIVGSGEGGVPVKSDTQGNLQVSGDDLRMLSSQIRELILIQKGTLKLLEAAFEDGLSGREEGI